MNSPFSRNNSNFFFFRSAKLLQDLQASGAPSASEWITGGSIGSKSAVLVFKTTAFSKCVVEDDDLDSLNQPSTSDAGNEKEKLRFPPVADAIPRQAQEIRKSSIKKFLTTSFASARNRLSKKNSDSMSSSSENSISSACEDPADLEADIAKAEKSTCRDKRALRFSADENDEKASKENLLILNSEEGADDSAGGGGNCNSDDQTTIDEMPASVLNITYKFTNTEKKLLKHILASHGLKEAKENQNFNLLWTGLHMKADVLRNLLPYQRVNHFPR